MFSPTYSVDQIREAEAPLLAAESEPDQFMRAAGHAVFQIAEVMLDWATPGSLSPTSVGQLPTHGSRRVPAKEGVLIVAGPGGNGGDALYAGAELASHGRRVDAYLTNGRAHERALRAFQEAGGMVLDDLPMTVRSYLLAIDGITGLGGTPGLREEFEPVAQLLNDDRVYTLAVDIPSGVEPDTGEGGDLHIDADVTVTFGGWRRAHALAPQCGMQLLTDVVVEGVSMEETLEELGESFYDRQEFVVDAVRAVRPHTDWPENFHTLTPVGGPSIEPRWNDTKFSGVIGVRAGSADYPGAAVLATAGAINATPALVRYVGPNAAEVVRAMPEVIAVQNIKDCGEVSGWVFGPGVGTSNSAAKELKQLLEREEPLLIDASGLTLIAEHPDLREIMIKRTGVTVLTPHDGEFEKLRKACRLGTGDRLSETTAVAHALNATVVRKGRMTIVADPARPRTAYVVDAGNSWGATPGSGDVLAGLIGVHMARRDWGEYLHEWAIVPAVCIHGAACKLAAETPFGPATAPASRIAEHIRHGTAKLAGSEGRGSTWRV